MSVDPTEGGTPASPRTIRSMLRLGGGVASAIAAVGIITLIARLVTAGRELVIAGKFGISDALDAYLIALMIPTVVVAAIASTIPTSLIPTLIQTEHTRGKGAAERLLGNITALSIGFLIAVSAMLLLSWPWIAKLVCSGFDPAKLHLTRQLVFMLVPIVLLGGICSLWSAVLNTRGRFASPVLVSIITPALAVSILGFWPGQPPVELLAALTTTGALAETILLAWVLRRHSVPIRPAWVPDDPATAQVLRQFLPLIAGTLIFSCTTLIDQAVAARLGSGNVSALSYGGKLINFGLGIASAAVGTAILPAFSRMVAEENWSGLRRGLGQGFGLILLSSLPAMAIISWLSRPITQLVFERGAFHAGDTIVVADVQTMYTLQMPFFLFSVVGLRLLSAMKLNQVIAAIAAVNVILKIVLNVALSNVLGVSGIALSTSLVKAFSCCAIYFVLWRIWKRRVAAPA